MEQVSRVILTLLALALVLNLIGMKGAPGGAAGVRQWARAKFLGRVS